MEVIWAFKSGFWQGNVINPNNYFRGVHGFSAPENKYAMSNCGARTRFQESNHLCAVFDRFCIALPILELYGQHQRVYARVLATISQNQRFVFKISG